MLTIHVWPKRLKEFLLTHPLYKSPKEIHAIDLWGKIEYNSPHETTRCAYGNRNDGILRMPPS